jgi:hypothetical protein
MTKIGVSFSLEPGPSDDKLGGEDDADVVAKRSP